MARKYFTLLVLALMVALTVSVQEDQLDQEPFLQVSDTYLKETKLTPWFRHEHLSLNSKSTPVKYAKSLIWGQYYRVIVMLEVNYQGQNCNKTRNVICMVDTGSEHTVISPKLMQLIGKDYKIPAKTPDKVPVEINGRPLTVKISKDYYHYDTSVIGMDFFKQSSIAFGFRMTKNNRGISQVVFRFDEGPEQF